MSGVLESDWRNPQHACEKTGRRLTNLHGEAARGAAAVIGFHCLMAIEPGSFELRPPPHANSGSWLPLLVERHGARIRALWQIVRTALRHAVGPTEQPSRVKPDMVQSDRRKVDRIWNLIRFQIDS